MPALAAHFLHPGLALAALALPLVPLLIHLLSRKRPRRMPWAAMSLLLAAYKRSARRVRFNRWLLLAMRAAAVLLIGFALARPLVQSAALPSVVAGRTHRVLIIDDTLAMRIRESNGDTRFARAVRAATKLLDGLPGDDPVSVVTLSSGRTLLRAARGHQGARAVVAGLEPTQRRGDPVAALNAADSVLRDTAGAATTADVYVFSSMGRGVWAEGPSGAASDIRAAATGLSERARLHVLRCVDGEEPNLSVTRFSARQRRVTRSTPVDLQLAVRNWAAVTSEALVVQIVHEGRIVAQAPVEPLAGGAERDLELTIAPPAVGPIVLEARLIAAAGDALTDDDRRYLTLAVGDSTPVLVVSAQVAPVGFDDEAGYLLAALSPGMADGAVPRFAARHVAASALADEPLGDYPLVVLCNGPSLPEGAWSRLDDYVRAGGGLLVTTGPRTDIEAYASAGVLPVRKLETASAAEGDAALRFAVPASDDDLFGAFTAVPESGLFRARVNGCARAGDVAPHARVHLRFTNQSPAVVTADRGAGRVGLLCTSADMTWTNLPAKGDFVALVQILAEQLSRDESGRGDVAVGGEFTCALSALAAVQPVAVTGPQRRVCDARVQAADGGSRLICTDTSVAGAYAVETADGGRAFAANVDPVASDPACLRADEVRALLGGVHAVGVESADTVAASVTGAGTELDQPLLWAGLLVLVLEMWAAKRMR